MNKYQEMEEAERINDVEEDEASEDVLEEECRDLGEIVLVVQGKKIRVDRRRLALISKFFRALFSHHFEDSHKAVLHLDMGGEMGLTVAAMRILADFAVTRQLSLSSLNAVQLFIAADALDVVTAREAAETFLGTAMLRPEKDTFLTFWRMSRFFHMKILESFLDCLCVENFGWFRTCLPLLSSSYLAAWPLSKLGGFLSQQKFANCSEEQVFSAVVSYCSTRTDKDSWEELGPGVYKSCGAYLRYLQSVPRMLPCKVERQ